MRSTMRPPWLRAESHAHRQLNTLPRCMRPEGDGAKRPTTGVGMAAGAAAVGVFAAGVAMLRALISMRTSIARRAIGETFPWLVSCRGRALRVPAVGSAPRLLLLSRPFKRQKPRQLFATAGVSAEKGDLILERTGKGQTVFAQLLYALRPQAQSDRAAPTQSRYTCDGAVKWYLLLARAMPRTVPNCRQIGNVPNCRVRA